MDQYTSSEVTQVRLKNFLFNLYATLSQQNMLLEYNAVLQSDFMWVDTKVTKGQGHNCSKLISLIFSYN